MVVLALWHSGHRCVAWRSPPFECFCACCRMGHKLGWFPVPTWTDGYPADGCRSGACSSERLRRLYSHTFARRGC